MKSRRLALLLAVALPAVAVAVLAACIGDEPSLVTSDDGGGPDQAVGPQDGSPGVDAADGASVVDSGTDSPAGLDVRSLPGLRLWLESTKELKTEAVGTGFASWRDSSGRFDGGPDPSAPDGGYHVAIPYQVNPPSIVNNGIGGRPTVSFTAGNGYVALDSHDDFQFGTGDFLIVEVAKISAGTGPLWRFKPQATAGSEVDFSGGQLCIAYGLGVSNGCTTPVYTPSTEPHVFAARRASSLFTVRVDGTQRSVLDVMGDPSDIFVSPFSQPYVFIGNNVTMQVSEVVVIAGPTSDANLNALESLLKTKFGIP